MKKLILILLLVSCNKAEKKSNKDIIKDNFENKLYVTLKDTSGYELISLSELDTLYKYVYFQRKIDGNNAILRVLTDTDYQKELINENKINQDSLNNVDSKEYFLTSKVKYRINDSLNNKIVKESIIVFNDKFKVLSIN